MITVLESKLYWNNDWHNSQEMFKEKSCIDQFLVGLVKYIVILRLCCWRYIVKEKGNKFRLYLHYIYIYIIVSLFHFDGKLYSWNVLWVFIDFEKLWCTVHVQFSQENRHLLLIRSDSPRRAAVLNYFADGTLSNTDDELLKGITIPKVSKSILLMEWIVSDEYLELGNILG